MTITFIIGDTFDTEVSIEHLGEHRPFKKRSVSIELTPEQEEFLKLRMVGKNRGLEVYEEIFECFVENDKDQRKGEGE